jgi:hypothetical protein
VAANSAILLEKKEDMKRRGLASPDSGDALCLTFAYPVASSDHARLMVGKPTHISDWDPFYFDEIFQGIRQR